VRLWYADRHVLPLPAGHKFPTPKYGLVRERLALDGRFQFEAAPAADLDRIIAVHDELYVRAFLDGSLDPRILRRIGFPWSAGLVARTLASVAGTMSAVRDAVRTRKWGGNLAGGTHHAFRNEGSGFCVFNDIAVAVCSLRREGLVRRAAIVDLDVHQGDGTADIFDGDGDVFTLSLHGRDNFPFRKKNSTVDVALIDGTGDTEYLEQLRAVLPRVFDFKPEIVFYQAGVDALGADTLGRLTLTHEGLAQRDFMVFRACRDAQVPCVVTMGGGYAIPIELTVQAHAATYLIAENIIGCPAAESA
jgi:acetoin utilization deacetylase AcuC-like enzyme